MKTTLLTLTDDGLRACVWRRGAMTPLQILPDATALARLTAVEKILLLVDVTEEDFRVEAVPPLPKAEQIALAHRRLTTLHGGTPFRRTVRLHRRDRREEVMSCSALTRPEQITPWLDALRHAPLAGIHSAATVSAALIRRIAGDHALLLSWEKHAGLRLSFFAHKHLHFSRLVPCRTIFPSAETLAEEAKRTRQYLIDTGLLAAERTPALCLLCNAAHRAEIETHDDTPYVFLDLDEHARRAGLKTRSTDSDATPLLLHLLASKPPRAHYANAEHTRNFRLRRYARAFYVAGIAALALSLASGASDLIEAGRLNDASQQARERNARLSPPAPITLPAPAAEMKEAVTLWQTAAPSAATPQTLLSALSETLLEQPTIQLERLSWETATQSIALEINLTPEPASYHQALKQVEGFRQRLSQHQYDARTLPPAEDAAEKRPLRFSLRLQYKETP